MFPFDLDDEEIELTELETDEHITSDYEIDFETGKLTGNIITGIDAIVQWVRLALSVERYKYPQYSWDYGTEISSLIGKQYDTDYLQSEVKRMITETLTVHEDIEGIQNFSCSIVDEVFTASFSLITTYGEVEVNDLDV